MAPFTIMAQVFGAPVIVISHTDSIICRSPVIITGVDLGIIVRLISSIENDAVKPDNDNVIVCLDMYYGSLYVSVCVFVLLLAKNIPSYLPSVFSDLGLLLYGNIDK